MTSHSERAAVFLKDQKRVSWHDETLWIVRKKRDKAAASVKDWEELRNMASQVKDYVLSNLAGLLMEFERNATLNGAVVHWAADADEFNRIVLEIIKSKNAHNIVKSKSMLTEECGLNHYLEERGVEIVDTDLGERIIQFRNEPPSHIVLPAIHLKKEDIGELFHEKLGTEKGATDPQYLTGAARVHLREKFVNAQVALTGVNFAVAENGSVVVCTNEGNADMGVHSAPVQIHCMGIEKIIPKMEHLGIFTRLLARNATGQAVTTYTSHYRSPKENGEMHVIIVDNGRTERLGNRNYRDALKCIRCGACMNTCPVYRRSGGHSYGFIIPGPIGTILAPHSTPGKILYKDLPSASSLCMSCSNVCPVKIGIHEQIYKLRQELIRKGYGSFVKRVILKISGFVFAKPVLYDISGKMVRIALRIFPRFLIYSRVNTWGLERELPAVPTQSFKEWYRRNGSNQ
ncbi:MAG: lactate utilization protein B [Rikenellaceae bacterium]|nr:lactate utilization protein B [Rikenellaceae bacterium]